MPGPSSSGSYEEDIVERRVSDPLATTLLVIGALCLAGAVAIQVFEVFQYRVRNEDTILDRANVYRGTLTHQAKAEWAKFEQTIAPVVDRWIAEMKSKGIDGRALYDEAVKLVTENMAAQ